MNFKQSTFEAQANFWLASVRTMLARWRIEIVCLLLVLILFGVSFAVLQAERGVTGAQIDSYPKALWWGVVTMLTVGYGDLVPLSPTGRILAALLMFSGVIAIGIITAKISAYFLAQVLLEGRSSVNKAKIKDHLVVCGWKEDMHDLVRHVLMLNPDLKAKDVVIVAGISNDILGAFRAETGMHDVVVIQGEHFHASTLAFAAPERARKVLILADTTPGHDGRRPNALECDARTIMASIALSHIAKGSVVTAELIDPALDHHLKLAGVTEIIYSREYSRMLIGSATTGIGVVNIVHDLVDPRNGSSVATAPVPEQYIDKHYREFRLSHEKSNPGDLVIGILENAGNPHKMKELAFREAQKTPSIAKLIDKLQQAKTLKCNNPVFHPADSYIVPKGAAAIVLKSPRASNGQDTQGPVAA